MIDRLLPGFQLFGYGGGEWHSEEEEPSNFLIWRPKIRVGDQKEAGLGLNRVRFRES